MIPWESCFGHYLIASVISMLIASLHRIIDSVFIGNGIGKVGIAAFNITLPLLSWVWAVIILFTVGGSTVYALRRGQKHDAEAKNVFYLTNFYIGNLCYHCDGFRFKFDRTHLYFSRL
jgi:Na+-driven multidrug efflux pump